MYGTVARMRMKPGAGDQMRALMEEYERTPIDGMVSTTVYRSDDDPDEVYLAVVFDSREAYRANAESPEQDERFRRMRELLEDDPEWHDGEVVWRGP
ncbi:MAG: antibiotic biosynthesis monooxygenase [Dehalococcoidia bacterium]